MAGDFHESRVSDLDPRVHLFSLSCGIQIRILNADLDPVLQESLNFERKKITENPPKFFFDLIL